MPGLCLVRGRKRAQSGRCLFRSPLASLARAGHRYARLIRRAICFLLLLLCWTASLARVPHHSPLRGKRSEQYLTVAGEGHERGPWKAGGEGDYLPNPRRFVLLVAVNGLESTLEEDNRREAGSRSRQREAPFYMSRLDFLALFWLETTGFGEER